LPTVHSDACTGCGKCEASCVLEVAAIKVYPIKLAKGEIGSHYRLGWEEKRKAGGKSLVENRNLVDLPDRLPDGVQLPGHWDPGSAQPAAPALPTPSSASAAGGIPDGLATLPGMPAPLSEDAPR